jgi:hypothetical protein
VSQGTLSPNRIVRESASSLTRQTHLFAQTFKAGDRGGGGTQVTTAASMIC